MPRSEDIVDRDLAIFAHGVVNISEIATFLPFLASEVGYSVSAADDQQPKGGV
jgi:hypothetical protein